MQIKEEMSIIWKDIKGYEGLYKVSNMGDIKRLKSISVRGDMLKEKLLKPQKDTNGYTRVFLIKNGKGKRLKRHRVIAENFIPNPKKKKEVNHINGVKHDNRVCNLEWVTPKENMKHAKENGLLIHPKGLDSYQSKLTKDQVEKIRSTPIKRGTITRLSKTYRVSRSTIVNIVKRYTYKNI